MNTIHTICIVDDDEEIRSLLSDYLRRNGFSTCTAGNAAEFLEIQRRVPCSLIVMDIMLPGMNGLELFRTLRAESTVPVIFLTALGDITDRIVGLELGADDYLSKPFEPRELLERTQGRNAVPYDRSIDVQISRLRTRLRDNGREPQLIKTVRGDGYVLATDVRPQFVRPALPVDAPIMPGK